MSMILAPNSTQIYREIIYQHQHLQQPSSSSSSSIICWPNSSSSSYGFGDRGSSSSRKKSDHFVRVEAGFWQAAEEVSRPASIVMEAIEDCDQLDQILLNAQQASQPILIDWMAAWCRKCIYLKPKLEKLAAEYDTKIKFYCVDVNKVPLALVKRGNISKMPTIQLWKDGEMKEEVIGGHKAWLVMDEVREMIQKYL